MERESEGERGNCREIYIYIHIHIYIKKCGTTIWKLGKGQRMHKYGVRKKSWRGVFLFFGGGFGGIDEKWQWGRYNSVC